MSINITKPSEIIYPESDGNPIADNTKQFNWIMTIKGGLDVLFKDNPNVFIAGDLLWYPVEGDPKTRTAPDAMVVFGRPKGDRGSYLQWQEGGIAPQVVFEVLSPGNRAGEMEQKRLFYQQYGVNEYYIYDPDRIRLEGWQRQGNRLVEINNMQGWVSPLLEIRFELEPFTINNELKIYRPDGGLFLSYLELEARASQAEQRSEQERQRAGQAEQRSEQERQRAGQAEQRAEQERQRAEKLLAQLRALGIEPEE